MTTQLQRLGRPCPDCGDNGPHLIVEEPFLPGPVTVVCRRCHVEFEVSR